MNDVLVGTWAHPECGRDARRSAPAVDAFFKRRAAVPRLPAHLAPRDGLLRRLDRLAPLTVLRALPGFGKTTLAAQWMLAQQSRGATAVWLRATPALDDPEAFAATVNAALGAALVPDSGAPLAPVPGDLAIAASPGDVVFIVVDDAHHLSDPAVGDLLAAALARSDGLHAVVCTDADEPFTPEAQRLGLDIQTITGAQLVVPAHHLGAWADAWGHELSPARAARLHELVGGWPLPLRLVLDATPDASEDFSTHVATDFLRDHVLPRLSDQVALGAASRLALPEQVDLPLVEALLVDDPVGPGHEASDRALVVCRELERHGLWWRVTSGEGQWHWRFPRLLRRTLAHDYERGERVSARADHRAIARLLRAADRRRLGEVLRHARRGEDWALLSRVWLEESWQLLEMSAEGFSQAYADLPERARADHPALHLPGSLADAVLRAPAGDPAERARFIMRHYMQVGLDHLHTAGQGAGGQDAVEQMIAAMVALRSEGRLREALGLVELVERELGRSRHRSRWAVRSVQSAWFHLQVGLTHLLAGRFGSAMGQLARAYETSPAGLTGSQSAALLAMMHSIRGSHDEARRWLERHDRIDVSDRVVQNLALVPAALARAMLALDRFDREAAEEALAGSGWSGGAGELWAAHLLVVTRHALLFGDPYTALARLAQVQDLHHDELADPSGVGRAVVGRCRADLLLAIGEMNQVQQLLRGREADPWLRAPAARLELVTGDVEQAHRIASAGAWRSGATLRGRAEHLMLTAVCALDLGRDEEAAAAFRQADSLCRTTHDRQPYLTPTADQLQRLLELSGLSLDQATAAAVSGMGRIHPERAAIIELSRRETEVLRRMRRHETAAAIARDLSVSVNTVRKQIVSLYAKLGVHDRASALLHAERLGLLED